MAAPVASASHGMQRLVPAEGRTRRTSFSQRSAPAATCRGPGVPGSWGPEAKPEPPNLDLSWPIEKKSRGSNPTATQPAPRQAGASRYATKVLPAMASQPLVNPLEVGPRWLRRSLPRGPSETVRITRK